MVFHSTFQNSYLLLPLPGFLIGLIASMIGGGGGFFFPPALILLFQVPSQIAVATSLAATLPICFAGAITHYRKGNLNFRIGSIFSIAGVIGALSGASVTGLLSEEQLKITFGVYAVLIATLMFFNNSFNRHNKPADNNINSRLKKLIPGSSFYGLAGGMISGTFGTSGTAPVLAGLFAMKVPLKLVAGTSLMIVFINTVFALAGHLVFGIIDLTLVMFLTTGSVIGAITGPGLFKGRILMKNENLLKQSYAWMIFAFGVIMIIT